MSTPGQWNEYNMKIDKILGESNVSLRSKKFHALAIVVGALSLAVLISGCASTPASGGTSDYNSDIDYGQLRYADHL
jgi:hypothetical protein